MASAGRIRAWFEGEGVSTCRVQPPVSYARDTGRAARTSTAYVPGSGCFPLALFSLSLAPKREPRENACALTEESVRQAWAEPAFSRIELSRRVR
jgi:hypothetical protein